MKKTDAHQFVMLTLQDYLNTLPKSSQLAMKDKLEAAMAALAPVPDEPAKEADHG
jgi:hypothetical protein